jgi:pimeloyl-ACP methyl ester carboxylesterase
MGKPLRSGLLIAAAILTIVLVGPFLVPIPALDDTLPPKELADPKSLFIDVNGLQLHYKKAGSGDPALILLHGFGASLFSWREVIEPLAGYGTVIAYDRPAFGLTERPLSWDGDLNPYSPQAQVELLIGLMDALDIKQAILVGNSAGGSVSIQTALEYPDRVGALVLVDPAVYQTGGTSAWLHLLQKTPQMDRLGPVLVRSIAKEGDASIKKAWHNPNLITPDIFEGYRLPLQADNWDIALWEFNKAAEPRSLEESLKEISIPVLVLSGDDDRLIPLEFSQRLAGDIPGAELVIFQDCGHLPQEECPEQFLEAVERFLAGQGY